jgi:hypothetical protein
MTASARDRARTLELIIRAAVAEERLLGARLARMAESQRRTREEIASARFAPPSPNGNGPSRPAGGASGASPAANGASPAANGAAPPANGASPPAAG